MLRKITLTLTLLLSSTQLLAQSFSLEEGPWVIDTYSPPSSIQVSVIARGIEKPWGMVFIPEEGILVAERAGAIRVIKNNVLLDTPMKGTPAVSEFGGLMDLTLHPEFASNRLLYFTYTMDGEPPEGEFYWATTVLGRGRLSEDLSTLTNVEKVFVTDAWGASPGGQGSRLLFAPDGSLFMSSPFRRDLENPQNTLSDISKLLRLNDDGSIPADNPFVGDANYLPEIYSIGHRTIEGMLFHPVTGELWASEHGPQGGDELNIIQAGENYGWPIVTFGRDYDGSRIGEYQREDIIEPELIWVPSIGPSSMMIYTGAAFPQWQNDLFVSSLMTARIPGTGHIERIEFNNNGEQKREWLLGDLKQRIRDVRQGPDGLIYVLTDEIDGALLKISPLP